jgi:ADP-ribosylglycohydrolase
MDSNKAKGCLFGLAFGDSLASATEFLSVREIIQRWPPDGPKELRGNPSLVTDDTQMAIAVGEALVKILKSTQLSPDAVESALRDAFIRWYQSPDNNRAPGRTCLEACRRLKAGTPWIESTVPTSKGCGANMRVAPVAFLSYDRHGVTPGVRSAIAQFQAAITHGHPTALAASDLTVYAITVLAEGSDPDSLIERLRGYAQSQRRVYHYEWLGSLWTQSQFSSAEEFISSGWSECLYVIDRLESAYRLRNFQSDPCLLTGEGWIAEEAFATGMLCFLLYPSEPIKALQRAAVTSGDSDSIASLTGAFAGAYLGLSAWPVEWIDRIEYSDRIGNILDSIAD